MLDQNRMRKLTEAMRAKLRQGLPFNQARDIVFRGLREPERGEYISAVARQLSFRAHEAEARRLPDVPKQKPKEVTPPQDPQLDFNFGEGPLQRKR